MGVRLPAPSPFPSAPSPAPAGARPHPTASPRSPGVMPARERAKNLLPGARVGVPGLLWDFSGWRQGRATPCSCITAKGQEVPCWPSGAQSRLFSHGQSRENSSPQPLCSTAGTELCTLRKKRALWGGRSGSRLDLLRLQRGPEPLAPLPQGRGHREHKAGSESCARILCPAGFCSPKD